MISEYIILHYIMIIVILELIYNTQTGNMNPNAEFRMKDNRQFYASLFL